jgi:hypothetical protein
VRGDERHRDERIVDVGPRCGTGRAIDDDVIVDEDGVEPDLLGLFAAATIASGDVSNPR